MYLRYSLSVGVILLTAAVNGLNTDIEYNNNKSNKHMRVIHSLRSVQLPAE